MLEGKTLMSDFKHLCLFALSFQCLYDKKGEHKMKRILALLLSLTILAAILVGCSPSTPSDSQPSGTEPVDGDNVLRVGMDLKFPPFSYIGEDGEPAGLEPIIAQAFADYLGMELEIVNTDFGLLIPALQTGDVDILIPDMSETEERAQQADFSDTYRYSQSLALVNKDFAEANNITDDMPPEEFFHLVGSEFIGLAGTFGVLVPQQFGAEVTEVTEIGTGILEVAGGQSTALVASVEVHSFHAANPDTTIVYHGIGNWSGSSFVVKKGDAEMLEKANEFIATMYEEGGLFDEISPEWDGIIAEFLSNDELGLDYIVGKPEGWVD